MNLLEAVKIMQGRLPKRSGDLQFPHETCKRLNLTAQDILATDWEIEERKIEITETEFEEALSEAEQMYGRTGTNFIKELKKRLFEK